MKQLAFAWLALVALAFAIAGSCAIDHRSGSFECAKTSDCDPPRVCSDGLCIVPAGAIDAPTDGVKDGAVDAAAACPPQCTSCNREQMTCIIDCALNGGCNSPVTCPAGWNCNIKCSTPDACRSGINCQSAESCDVTCSGNRACRNLTCGGGPCNVTCNGTNSCANIGCGTDRCTVNCTGSQSCHTIICGQSCACDVKCGNLASCDGVSCAAPQCDIGRDCSSLPLGCDTCQ
jgi:hypothetical protein